MEKRPKNNFSLQIETKKIYKMKNDNEDQPKEVTCSKIMLKIV